jgi:hypothetical protein
LLKEYNNKLIYATNDPEYTYKFAIDCINKHLELGRPIIVGVNHTIGNTYNEGTTDHFVVIYGRVFVDDDIHYMYYEVGKSNVTAGYNDDDNRFIYKGGSNPEFCDNISKLKGGVRIDVTQVRPNI